MTTQNQSFNADISRLLDIVANALYTNHDIFLRELISNSADACDRLRYDAITKPELIADNPNFRIHIHKDTETRTLTIIDNGVGMNKKELTDNLGTIAKSGTASLMEKMSKTKEQKDRLNLIGQFGVGFYASYMVADRVTVISRKAGSKSIWVWESDGRSGFEVRNASANEKELLDGDRGTVVILNIKDEGSEFLLDEKIKQTVQQYSDNINIKIFLNTSDETDKGEGQPINSASALWARPKSEITKEQYDEFYRHITHGFDEPQMTSHWHAEGKIEYTALLFLPTMRPWDLYDPSRKSSVRLYIRRVMIADDLDGLMYPWLRFVRGIIDSEDLPLNINRESLQYNPVLAKIRTGITKRILSDLDKLSRDEPHAFITFWGQFGSALKEGLYDAVEHRDAIFKVCRFYSTHEDGEKFVSLSEYVKRMKDGQNEIYYISGENTEALKNSPQIEGFKSRNIEVMFFTDTIDDFWLQQVEDFQGKKFKSVTKGDINLDDNDNKDNDKDNGKSNESSEKINKLSERLKEILKEDVENVRPSKRLTNSPVCLVASESGVDMHMERVLKIHQQYSGETKPILEINEDHPLIKKLATLSHNDNNNENFNDAAQLLLEQARIIQGESLKDPAGFAKRMSFFMEKGLM
ncbi:MAG: molecular chaperone HtpG [Alphaproteobacteria bacterium]|nr:molecular chaperone HtpG [Alphaproteobacteria bacterium]